MNVFKVFRGYFIVYVLTFMITMPGIVLVGAVFLHHGAPTWSDKVMLLFSSAIVVFSMPYLFIEAQRVGPWTRIDEDGVHQRQWRGHKYIAWDKIIAIEEHGWGVHIKSQDETIILSPAACGNWREVLVFVNEHLPEKSTLLRDNAWN